MKPTKGSLLLHPAFIICLIFLLLNDFYWKYEYHNWVTGKLSDVTGLVVLPLLLKEVFKKVPKIVLAIFTALLFTWWKAPFSQPLIDLFSSFSIVLHRTIDYTDLFTLLVLPFLFFIQPVSYARFPFSQTRLKHALGLIAFFALCADTPYRMLPYDQSPPNEVRYSEEFCWRGSEEELLQNLHDRGLAVSKETERYYPLLPYYS